jgi:dinuclear metal center YbgI/SA1388 family protein
MVALTALQSYCDHLLAIDQYTDFAPNGLQVEGRPEVQKVVFGVTACQSLIDQAIAQKADALLVHHGFFWKGEDPTLIGMRARRLRALMTHHLSLLAYHIPLDAHAEYGNNACLARDLDLIYDGCLPCPMGDDLIQHGTLSQAISAEAMTVRITERLGRKPLYLSGGEQAIKKVAWCSGAAQDFITIAAMHGCDAYISGEVSERTTHQARELGLHYFAAGHHATERGGVQALAQHLSEQFALDCVFIDVDNPA